MLEVGCGGGWSSIALARAYPEATRLGIDIDQPSVDLAVAAVMCPATLQEYVEAAGFGAFEVLPIEGFGF